MSIPIQLSGIRCKSLRKKYLLLSDWSWTIKFIYKHDFFFFLKVDSKFQQIQKMWEALVSAHSCLPLSGSLRFNLGQLGIFLLLFHNYRFLLSPVELMEKTISDQNVDIFQKEFWQRLMTGQSEFSQSWGPSVAKVQPQNEPVFLGRPLFPTSSCLQCTLTCLPSKSRRNWGLIFSFAHSNLISHTWLMATILDSAVIEYNYKLEEMIGLKTKSGEHLRSCSLTYVVSLAQINS